MRIVKSIEKPEPGKCVVNLTNQDPEGFIDTQNRIRTIDPDVYISIQAVREMAKMIGMVTREQVQESMERAASLTADNERLEEELKDRDRELEAVELLKRVERRQAKKESEIAA